MPQRTARYCSFIVTSKEVISCWRFSFYLTDVYMTVFVPANVAARLAYDGDARLIIGAIPQYVIPAKVSFPNTQFVACAQAVLYRGAGIDLVWPHILAMAVIGLTILSLCRSRFSRAISSSE